MSAIRPRPCTPLYPGRFGAFLQGAGLFRQQHGIRVAQVLSRVGRRRTASVVAEEDCVVTRLSTSALARMERDDPGLATLLQGFLIAQLAHKQADSTRVLEMLLR